VVHCKSAFLGGAKIGEILDISKENRKIRSGNRIVTASAPGMAAPNAFCGEFKSFKKTVLFERLNPVFTAGWLVSAAFGKQRTKHILINADEEDGQPTHGLISFSIFEHIAKTRISIPETATALARYILTPWPAAALRLKPKPEAHAGSAGKLRAADV